MLKILGDLKAKGVKRVGLELYPTHSGAATRGLVVSDGDTTFFHALQRRGEELGLEVIPLDNAKRYREEFDDHVKAKWRKRTPTGIIAQTLRIPFNLQRLVEGLSVQTAAKFSGNAHMIEEILRNKLNEPGCAVLCGEGHGQTIARLMPEFTHFDLHPLRAWARLVDAPTTWQSHRLTRKRLERKKLIGPAHKR